MAAARCLSPESDRWNQEHANTALGRKRQGGYVRKIKQKITTLANAHALKTFTDSAFDCCGESGAIPLPRNPRTEEIPNAQEKPIRHEHFNIEAIHS